MDVLRRRREFLAVASGSKVETRGFVLQSRAREEGSGRAPRVGFTVTKRVGGAVERNRIKRRLRAAIRQVAPFAARAGFDYVLVGRRAALNLTFTTLTTDLETAFRRGQAGPSKRQARNEIAGP
jgi:ribonuclease P protein component